jgi:hypothetical protein
MCQQLASIKNFAASSSKNGITFLRLTSDPQEILLTAIELKLSLERFEVLGLQIGNEALTLHCG